MTGLGLEQASEMEQRENGNQERERERFGVKLLCQMRGDWIKPFPYRHPSECVCVCVCVRVCVCMEEVLPNAYLLSHLEGLSLGHHSLDVCHLLLRKLHLTRSRLLACSHRRPSCLYPSKRGGEQRREKRK